MKLSKTFVKRSLLVLTLILAGALSLQSCSNLTVNAYSDIKPELDIEEFFTGSLTAHGVVKNRAGKVIRHFNATIEGTWNDEGGVLHEEFLFSDGEEQTRIWKLRKLDDENYIGTAADVIGEGKLKLAGNALFLNYVLRVPYNDGTIDVRVDDRMYKVDDNTIINESILTKFGFKVGSVVLTIVKSNQA